MITIQEIQENLAKHKLFLRASYDHEGIHQLEVYVMDKSIEYEILKVISLTISGIKFKYKISTQRPDDVPERNVFHIFECVFSNEVLLNSIGVTFECSK